MTDATTPENWRPVPGYEARYEVSDLGRVRSLVRATPRVLAQLADRDGYLRVSLHRDGRQTVYRVHVLVAAAFLGPRPAGSDVRHLDGAPGNNVAVNLAYGSRSENQRDSVRHGTHHAATMSHCRRGHPFDEANTRLYVTSRGTWARECRACSRDRSRAKRARAAGRSQTRL